MDKNPTQSLSSILGLFFWELFKQQLMTWGTEMSAPGLQ